MGPSSNGLREYDWIGLANYSDFGLFRVISLESAFCVTEMLSPGHATDNATCTPHEFGYYGGFSQSRGSLDVQP
jgi:hypothetical protein